MEKIWHEKPWQTLLAARKNGQLAHAYLFYGQEGVGKLAFALDFIQSLFCDTADVNTGSACGKCYGCRMFLAGSHPDYLFLTPEEKSNNIKIDAVRNLITHFSHTPSRGGCKLALIAPADALNLAAANALLKTLEEPEGKAILILVTARKEMLPLTVQSRCQKLFFRLPSAEIKSSFGSQDKLWCDLIDLRRQKQNIVCLVEKYTNADLRLILASISAWSIELIKLKSVTPTRFLNLSTTTIELILPDVWAMNLKRLFNYVDKLQKLQQILAAGISLNKQLLLEDVFIDCIRL